MKFSNHYRWGKMAVDWFGNDCSLVGKLALLPAAMVAVLEMFEEVALSTNDLAQRMASHYDFQLQSELKTICAASASCRSSGLNSKAARSSERKGGRFLNVQKNSNNSKNLAIFCLLCWFRVKLICCCVNSKCFGKLNYTRIEIIKSSTKNSIEKDHESVHSG